MLVEIGILST